MKYTVKLVRQVDVVATVEIEASTSRDAEVIAIARDENDDVGEWEISWESATDAEIYDIDPEDAEFCQCDIPQPNEYDFCGTCGLQIEEEE